MPGWLGVLWAWTAYLTLYGLSADGGSEKLEGEKSGIPEVKLRATPRPQISVDGEVQAEI